MTIFGIWLFQPVPEGCRLFSYTGMEMNNFVYSKKPVIYAWNISYLSVTCTAIWDWTQQYLIKEMNDYASFPT